MILLKDLTLFYYHALGPYEEIKLTTITPVTTIVRAMGMPDSGLEIKDRMWLKITIPNAFTGKIIVALFCMISY